MRTTRWAIGPCLLAVSIAAAASGPAAAAPKPITGTLSKPGYTVIALAANGAAEVVRPSQGKFRLSPPATRVTLHLRAPSGTYAGPVVLKQRGNAVSAARQKVRQTTRRVRRAEQNVKRASGKQAKMNARRRLSRARRQLRKAKRLLREARRQAAPNRAILGVKAGAPLGRVTVNSAAGYAVAGGLRRRAWTRWVDTRSTARARRGVPIGAGNFGHVPSQRPRRPLPGDLDLDGIADVLDIDDDGDLVLDNFDRSNRARASQQAQQFNLSSQLALLPYPPPNANAPGAVDPEAGLPSSEPIIDALLGGLLYIEIRPGGPVELDCAGDPAAGRPGLSYCSKGGTGRLVLGPAPDQRPEFPECCDRDGPDGAGDGFGTLGSRGIGARITAFLIPGARSADIKSGQVLVQHVATGGDENLCPPPPGQTSLSCAEFTSTLQYVFATVGALKSYSDTATPPNSATVYPPGGPTPGPGGPGTRGNGFPVTGSGATGDGDVFLTLTFWRPQRRPIPPDPNTGLGGDACAKANPPCAWIDIGGLLYKAKIGGGLGGPVVCPGAAYSNTSLTPFGGGEPGLIDGATDQAANPNNTVIYTLNASECLRARGLTWPRADDPATPGEREDELTFTFSAQPSPNLADTANLLVTFRRE